MGRAVVRDEVGCAMSSGTEGASHLWQEAEASRDVGRGAASQSRSTSDVVTNACCW